MKTCKKKNYETINYEITSFETSKKHLRLEQLIYDSKMQEQIKPAMTWLAGKIWTGMDYSRNKRGQQFLR